MSSKLRRTLIISALVDALVFTWVRLGPGGTGE